MLSSPPVLPIEFVIVGGAISGLTAAVALARVGHKVTVIDENPSFFEVSMGGGCRIPPNATKLFYRWGLGEALHAASIKSTGVLFAQFDNGSLVGSHEWEESVIEETGGDFLLITYEALRRILAESAVKHGAVLRPSSQVHSVKPDAERPYVTLASGEVLTADVIIGADGCHFPGYLTRRAMLQATGQADIEKSAGWQLFNALIPESALKDLNDPAMLQLKESGKVYTWYGRTYGALGFPVPEPKTGSPFFTLFVYVPRQDPDGTAASASKEQLLEWLQGCDPRITTLAGAATKIMCIPMVDRPFLNQWVHPDGRLICIGESAHPLSAGSIYSLSLAVCDAAALGKFFSHLHRREQITTFLNAVQEVREPRVNDVIKASAGNIFAVALPPGIAEKRDRELREHAEEEVRNLWNGGSHNTSAEMVSAIEGIFAYDSEDGAESWWQQWGLTQERAERIFAERPLSVVVTQDG